MLKRTLTAGLATLLVGFAGLASADLKEALEAAMAADIRSEAEVAIG